MVDRNVDRITVEICIQQLGRVEEIFDYHMMRVCQRLQRHLWELGILKRLIVSPAVYPRFLEIAKLARSLP